MSIQFKKANSRHKAVIFKWLKEQHVMEFWDNSQAHKNDIIRFINNRKEPSDYAEGRYVYWVGLSDGEPL